MQTPGDIASMHVPALRQIDKGPDSGRRREEACQEYEDQKKREG